MAAERLRPLTKDQVTILKKTFRLLDTDSLAKRFYSSLFLKYPEVKPLFPDDLSELSIKLISVFELVIHSFEEHSPNEFFLQETLIAPLRALGKKHTDKGVESVHYPIANDLLLQAIKEEAGYILPVEAEVAWKLALGHLTSAMMNSDVKTDPSQNYATIRDSFNYIKGLFK
jgi:hemoglobin-like flavoprotein